jgi:hypothetical protein
MVDVIPFTEEDVKAYLDRVITDWRRRKDNAGGPDGDTPMYAMATCHIDAYQSVRISLFGELLSIPEVGESMEEAADEWMGGDDRVTIPVPNSGTVGDPNRR